MIAIVKYNAGNITSVKNALERLGYNCTITDNPDELKSASHVIFPGVGEAGTAMKYLKDRKLDVILKSLKQPVLGICLGLQLLCSNSEEGDTQGLGIFDVKVKKFPATGIVPHMGWNNLRFTHQSFLNNISETDDFYFVHSFYAELGNDTVASCEYLVNFSAVLQKENFYATQFHPEKSGKIGEQILLNFLQL